MKTNKPIKKNRIVRLLEFRKEVLKINSATLKELYHLQEDYAIFYNKITSQIRDRVLREHHYPLEEWIEVLRCSSSFWFGPGEKEERINNAIKAGIRDELGFLPPQRLESNNLFSGQVSSLI